MTDKITAGGAINSNNITTGAVTFGSDPATVSMQEVFENIAEERAYQNAGAGNAKRHEDMPPLTPGEIILAMEKTLEDARAAWYKPDGPKNCRPHIRKVAALGVQLLERTGVAPVSDRGY